MGKSLYSVVLMDEVVKEIDRLCLRENTNRSNLINQILAEYVSYTTPEMRINSIFRSIEELFTDASLVPMISPHQSTMSLKGSLEYRYRPTVKYDVELYRHETEGAMGRLSVIFRTQSQALLNEMNNFFKLWCYLEKSVFQKDIAYGLSEGRLIRSISVKRNCTTNEIAHAISVYIRLFDDCIKGYLGGRYDENDILLRLKAHAVKEVLI